MCCEKYFENDIEHLKTRCQVFGEENEEDEKRKVAVRAAFLHVVCAESHKHEQKKYETGVERVDYAHDEQESVE
jgi:hypothetical protein